MIFKSTNSVIYFIDDIIISKLIDIEWVRLVKMFVIYISSSFIDFVLKKYKDAVSRSVRVDEYSQKLMKCEIVNLKWKNI